MKNNAKNRKRTKLEKENALLRDLLYHLTYNAKRVSDKYGHSDDDVPSDWQEWVDLRTSIKDAQSKGKIT